MKVTAFDFFPWFRPFADRWCFLVSNQMSELMAAGGYRMKWVATPNDLASDGGGGFDTKDFYLNVIPGSYVWALSMWDNPQRAYPPAACPNVPVGLDATEIEIVDSSTREVWFESSQDSSNLGAWNFSDDLTVHDQPTGLDVTEQMGFYYNMWMLQHPRLILGNGVQRVRFTQNSSQSLGSDTPLLAMWVLEPISGGVVSGL